MLHQMPEHSVQKIKLCRNLSSAAGTGAEISISPKIIITSKSHDTINLLLRGWIIRQHLRFAIVNLF